MGNSIVNTKNIAVKGLELQVDMMIQGIAALVPARSTVLIDGTSMTQPELLRAAQALQTSFKERRDLRSAFTQKQIEIDETTTPSAKKMVAACKIMAATLLGASNPSLATFGFKPKRKPTPLTSEQKSQKAKRSRATREARHTLGPRQKLAIMGSAPAGNQGTPASLTSQTQPDAAKKVV